MSMLIEQYSAANRVIDTALAVTYSKSRVYGQWSWAEGTSIVTRYEAWSYVRSANKSYRYVGMTKAAADSCASDMRAKYLRTQRGSVFSETQHEFISENVGTVPMADVVVQHVAGEMWDVIINVRETDAQMRFSSMTAKPLFSSEDARDYDGESVP